MLTERQKLILKVIVNSYIQLAEPVGSRALSKHEDIGFSPATIRNEMSDLEDMGFLEQPHTSAGRIPSHKGYRYYVDYLISPDDILISKETVTDFQQVFTDQFIEMEQTLEQTASVLSKITNYTSIILGPEIYQTKLRHIQIIPLNENNLVAILVTNTGKVQHKSITIPQEGSAYEIEKIVNFLNAKLIGVPLYQLKSLLMQEINREFQKNEQFYGQIMNIIHHLFHDEQEYKENKLFLSGTTNILNQPEFSDVNTIKEILTLFEKSDDMIQLIKPTENGKTGIEVKIGTENHVEAASNCSIITATYEMDGNPVGTIGIFGPTRMDYKKVISILDFLSKDFNHFISRLYKG